VHSGAQITVGGYITVSSYQPACLAVGSKCCKRKYKAAQWCVRVVFMCTSFRINNLKIKNEHLQVLYENFENES